MSKVDCYSLQLIWVKITAVAVHILGLVTQSNYDFINILQKAQNKLKFNWICIFSYVELPQNPFFADCLLPAQPVLSQVYMPHAKGKVQYREASTITKIVLWLPICARATWYTSFFSFDFRDLCDIGNGRKNVWCKMMQDRPFIDFQVESLHFLSQILFGRM